MVTTEELEAADPQQWARAADAWEACAELWSASGSDYQKQVLHKLEHWSGVAGWVAKRLAQRLQTDFDGSGDDDVAGWMKDVSRVLRTFSDDLADAQAKLEQAVTMPEVDASVMVESARQAAIAEATELAEKADHTAARRLHALLDGEGWVDAFDLSPSEAADLMRKAAAGDQRALAELKAHKKLFSDPHFAQAFLEELGPEGLVQLPGIMEHRIVHHRGGDDPERVAAANEQLLGMLSDALATGTDPANPAWKEGELTDYLRELTEAGRDVHEIPGANDYRDGYWALGQIMAEAGREPPYSTEFLSTVGADMVAADRERAAADPNWPSSAAIGIGASLTEFTAMPTDPLSGLLHAAGTNGEGAQAILANDDNAGNLQYLLQDRPWIDHGDALGEAIEAAAHPDLGDPEDAALVAGQTVDTLGYELGQDLEGTQDRFSAMQDSIGRMLGSRINEVSTWVNENTDPSAIRDPNDPTKAQYAQDLLARVVQFAASDDDGYTALLNAEIRYAGESFSIRADAGDGDSARAAQWAGKTFGFINEARETALEQAAVKRDEANAILAEYASKSIGLLEIPSGLTGLAAQEAANALIDKLIRSDHLSESQAAAAADELYAQKILQDIADRVVVNNPHLLYEGAQTPQEWAEANDVEDDADRQEESARRTALLHKFYDTERQALRPPEELAANDGSGLTALRDYINHPAGPGRARTQLSVDAEYLAGEQDFRRRLSLDPKHEQGY